jgi:hypothetical protein
MSRFNPLSSYRGIESGPNWERTFVGAKSRALDGTKQRLRDPRVGSPFTFRVVPPDTLLDALTGRGAAQTQGIFDPLLREQFLAAERQLEALRSDPAATDEQIAEAAQALLGGRAPAPGQNIGIIDAAVRSTNNYGAQVQRRENFRRSNFFATGPTRGAALTRLENFVASNGIQFNPQNPSQTPANQTAVADLTQALDVLVQLNRIAVTPPLTLLVNPEQLSITYAKKQQYQDRSRYNYIFQSWGEEQVRLSVSGKSAGFVVGEGRLNFADVGLGGERTNSVSGYQYASKLDSAAWQNLMGLFSFYRNNGYIYDNSQNPRSEAHLFIGHIEISYDQFVYLGQFENFSYSYSEGKQHGAVEFSFDFVVSYMYDNAQGGPVTPIQSPTPSPSGASGGRTPFVPSQQAKATATQTSDEDVTATAILDPGVDPFTSSTGLLGRANAQSLEDLF